MMARDRQDTTISAPGSPRIKAISAEASRTAGLSKPLLHLAARLCPPFGNQFVRKQTITGNQGAHAFLNAPDARHLGLNLQDIPFEGQEQYVSRFNSHPRSDFGGDDNAAVVI